MPKRSTIEILSLACLALQIVAGNAVLADEPQGKSWRSGFPGSKMAIEMPLKKLISKETLDASSLNLLARRAPDRANDNPHVQPGLVAWLPDQATACLKAKTSGKPVLVFQMMGKLDDEFC